MRACRHRRAAGFTLIELMIVVAIIGILAAIALPNYQEYVRKSRRSDATSAITQIAQTQERWRANNATYASSLASLGLSGLTSDYYTFSLTGVSGTNCTGTVDSGSSYCIKAVAKGKQVKDSGCTELKYRVVQGNMIREPASCWAK